MKTLAVLSLGGMLWAVAGCTDSAGDVSDASDLDSQAPVADVSGNPPAPASSQGSEDASQASSSDDQVSTFDGDAAQTFEDVTARHCDSHNRMPNNVPVHDATGVFTSVSSRGYIDLENEFFQDLGTNGRRCVSCHVPTSGWSITPKQLRVEMRSADRDCLFPEHPGPPEVHS